MKDKIVGVRIDGQGKPDYSYCFNFQFDINWVNNKHNFTGLISENMGAGYSRSLWRPFNSVEEANKWVASQNPSKCLLAAINDRIKRLSESDLTQENMYVKDVGVEKLNQHIIDLKFFKKLLEFSDFN